MHDLHSKVSGLIFDIKEFALHDGEGIRTTVFLKGCPLRCIWCHNPEGLSPKPELSVKKNRCKNCGLCQKECSHEDCKGLNRCLHICPDNLVERIGTYIDSDTLARKLLKQCDFLNACGGGITFSGGEPLLQHEFLYDVIKRLKGKVHIAIETSGFAPSDVFRKVIELCDFVYMDLKIADKEKHIKFTGVDNSVILQNAEILKSSGIPSTFSVPLIPGITDSGENLAEIRKIAGDTPVRYLKCNPLAGAKYDNIGKEFLYDKESK